MPTKYHLMQTLECWSFKWIGQSLETCDGCGKPYWEHTHMETGGTSLFRWVNVLISDTAAQQARDIWEGYGGRHIPYRSPEAAQNAARRDAANRNRAS